MPFNIVTVAKNRQLHEVNKSVFKQFKLHCHYRKDYKYIPVASKFYSKYASDFCNFDQEELDAIIREKQRTPKDENEWPQTSNQEYGWYDPVLPIDKVDPRLFHPMHKYDFIEQQLKVVNSDAIMKTEKFAGTPWH